MTLLAWLFWNPDPIAFHIPYFNHPITWYALFFVFGFVAGFWMLVPMLKEKIAQLYPERALTARADSIMYIDGLTWCIIIGTLVGARLGHVFFYEWPRYSANPIEILKTWEGGLASHGGAVGVMIAVYGYYRYRKSQYPKLTFIDLLDLVSVPVAFVAVCIRLGNFMNQEILGTPTALPWGVVFGRPIGLMPTHEPMHPAQLYEALAYLATFGVLLGIWLKQRTNLRPGLLIGSFFILIFGSRFVLEFWKARQSLMIDESFLQTGQYLSVPFIVLGLFLVLLNKRKKQERLSDSSGAHFLGRSTINKD